MYANQTYRVYVHALVALALMCLHALNLWDALRFVDASTRVPVLYTCNSKVISDPQQCHSIG